MKRGQLLSQPFFYIFAIIVIGLILVFGFKYVGKVLNTGCQVEVLDFTGDVQAKVNDLVALSYGSSFECSVVKGSGQSNSRCEFVLPDNVRGICFVDPTKTFNPNDIPFNDTRNLVVSLGRSANKNLFFSTTKGASCKTEPASIKKLTTDGAICLDARSRNASLIMENAGNEVIVRKA